MTDSVHIHCSSRFDRSADSLETDLDDWMSKSDLITLTEVTNDHRAARLREKGWGYFNSKIDNGSDNCAICWRTDTWARKGFHVVELQNNRYYTLTHHVSPHVYAITQLLKHKTADVRLMVSVTHFPAHVQGNGTFGPRHGQTDAEWRARKLAYTTAMKTWSDTIKTQRKAMKPDCVLVVADWNLDLKEAWVRNYQRDHFQGTDLQLAWRHFDGLGTSIDGGSRAIDGSMYTGMAVSEPPRIMAAVRSSDHRPYVETFQIARGHNEPEDWDASGSTKGDPWWGFGDYKTDEMFVESTGTGERGGEVL